MKNLGFIPYCHPELDSGSCRSRKGFTLIELLVVVLIIGVLTAIAVPQYQKAVLKSRYVQLETLGRAIYNAEQLYYLAHGEYTDNFENLDLGFPGKLNDTKKAYRFSFGICTIDSHYNEGSCSLGKLSFFQYFGYRHARCRCESSLTCSVCQSVCKRTAALEIPEGKTYVECTY